MNARTLRIGLISDTHGLLRPEALAALEGSARILHAGDIGTPSVLEALATLAPLTAVRGNNDSEPWAQRLRESEIVAFGNVRIGVVHDLAQIGRFDGQALDALVCGHSHRPCITHRGTLLVINPGSAGPRRFALPVSVGELVLDGDALRPRLITLAIAPARRR